jgi:NAD-dependent SIR2 family protein deacetylase
MSNIVENLCQSICSGEIVVLCGAGISRESGLPIVNELVPFILRKLGASAEEEISLKKVRLPFESFIDTLAAETNISQLLNIYRGGTPNATHTLLAKLMKRGYLKTICSMNFDRLIETSLNNAGLKTNVDFDVVYRESEFDKIDLHSSRPILIKLHGCISDERKLGVSIKHVANKISVESRSRIIKQLFSDGPHWGVLVLGYSCSDVFDVSR